MSRLRRAVAAAAAALAGAPLLVLAGGTPPAAAASTICVGVVVNYGSSRPGGGANSFCATVSPGITGADVLVARAAALHLPPPVFGTGGYSGFVCAIDGYPRNVDPAACARTLTGGGARYWSYWHEFAGSTGWSYSTSGAGGFHVGNGSVEGWSYQDGGGEGTSPPPVIPYASICRPAPQPSTAPAPPVTRAPSPAPPGTTGPAPGAASGAVIPPPAATATTRHPAAGADPHRVVAAGRGSPSAAHRPGGTTTQVPGSRRPTASAQAAGTGPPAAGGPAAPDLVRLTARAGRPATAGSGPPWPTVLGLSAAVVLAAAAGWQVRRRRREAGSSP